MKKLTLVLVLLFFIVTSIFFYLSFSHKKEVSLSRFLPEDTFTYFEQKEAGRLFEKFRNTPLAKSAGSIDYLQVALDIDLPVKYVNLLRDGLDIITSPTFSKLADLFVSENFSLALLSSVYQKDPKEFFKKNAVLMCTPKHDIRLIETFRYIFGGDLEVENSTYGNHLIKRMDLFTDLSVSFVSIRSRYLIAFDQRVIRRALDRYDENTPNFSENYFYQDLKKKYAEAETFFFFSFEKFLRENDQYILKSSARPDYFLQFIHNWKGFTAGAFGVWNGESFRHDIVTLHYNRNELNKRTAEFLNIRPEKNRRLDLVPNDTLLYYWTNTFNLPTMWDIYSKESGRNKQFISNIETAVEQLTGKNIKELCSLVGSNVHIITRKPSSADFVPSPNITIIFEIPDRVKTEKLVDDFFLKNEIPHGTGVYRNQKFTYWGEAMQKGIQPVYCFYENIMFVSSSFSMHSSVIDTLYKKDGIIQTPEFGILAGEFIQKNNSVCFMQFTEMLDVVKELVSWWGTMIAIQNRQVAYKSKIIIDQLIQPLLDGMKMYDTIATSSLTEEGVLIMETKIRISK